MIVKPPGFTISVLEVDSRFTIVTWTVVLAPADSERTLRLMVRSSGSGFWTWIPETGPPCAVSVNEPVTPSRRVTVVVDETRVPAPWPGDDGAGGAGDWLTGGAD